MRQMEEKEIEQRVKRIICETLRLQSEAVENDSDLIIDLGADSLDSVRVQMAIEEEFEIAIPEDVANELNKVGDYVAYVRKQVI